MTSDIFLKQDGIEAVTTNEKSLAVTTGEDKDPDIRLSPNSAALTLGGGAGDHSDGDIRLMDRPDNGGSKPRIHLTGGTGSTDSSTRVRIDGSDGTAKLGTESADNPDISLLSPTADVELGGGPGGNGTLQLVDADGDATATVESEHGNGGAGLSLSTGGGDTTADIDAGKREIELGGAGGGGTLRLVDSDGDASAIVESERTNGGAGLSLSIAKGDTTADIDAQEREMELGGAGVGGTLLLTDGQGTTFELTVQDGTIRLGSADNGKVAMELEPDEGLFKIVDGDDDTGFQVDTKRKTVKKGQKYTGGVVGRGS